MPGTLNIVEGGIRQQCRLSLRHVSRIIKAVDPNTQLRDVVQVNLHSHEIYFWFWYIKLKYLFLGHMLCDSYQIYSCC